MEPMRWNNADPNPGARPQTSVFRGDKGLDVANQNRASGGGRKMFLTCPYIDQATTPIIPGSDWPGRSEWVLSEMAIFCCLLVPKRLHGSNLSGLASRDVAGEARHRDQKR